MTINFTQGHRHDEILAGRPDPFMRRHTLIRRRGETRWHTTVRTDGPLRTDCGRTVVDGDAVEDGPLAWVGLDVDLCHNRDCTSQFRQVHTVAQDVHDLFTGVDAAAQPDVGAHALLHTNANLSIVGGRLSLTGEVDRIVARGIIADGQRTVADALRAVRATDPAFGARIWAVETLQTDRVAAELGTSVEYPGVHQAIGAVRRLWPAKPTELPAALAGLECGPAVLGLIEDRTDMLLRSERDGLIAAYVPGTVNQGAVAGYPHRHRAHGNMIAAVPASIIEAGSPRLWSQYTIRELGPTDEATFDRTFDLFSDMPANFGDDDRELWAAASRLI